MNGVVDRLEKIEEEINKIDLPMGDYFDLEKFWKIVRDEDLSFNDVFEGLAQAMNTLVNIRAILNNEE